MSVLERALWWIEKGFSILPCQPNTKYLVGGFGQYRAKLANADAVVAWWKKNNQSNIAVLAPENHYVLDFDDIATYCIWLSTFPSAGMSYTETTPSGGKHVFFSGVVPAGIKLITGVEIKRVVIVAPSVVNGVPYTINKNNAGICGPEIASILSPLSLPGHATPVFLQADRIRRNAFPAGSRIDEIKKQFKISYVMNLYRPEIKPIGHGDWQSCRCPFHEDRKPSFAFNDQLGIWTCHGCNVRGDVINLYARFEAVNVREAISRMWAVMA